MQSIKDYRPSDYLIPEIELEFDLDNERTLVLATLHLVPNPAIKGPLGPLKLDGVNLELLEISLDGVSLSPSHYQQSATHLTLPALDKPSRLMTRVAISPKANLKLEGLYASQSLLCTQCEAEGFRHITFAFDRPDVLSKWSVKLRGDKKRYPHLLAGGEKLSTQSLANNIKEVHWSDPWPKPTYLFALAAGPLFEIEESYTTLTHKKIALFLYCEPHNKERLAFAMQSLKRAMRWDEEYFGREYDLSLFQIVAVDSFNMGAMENKGLNIFNAQCLLAHKRATTDNEFRRIEAIIAHEYFHNWTGNRITCRDWFQLTLKEGLTVLRDQLFSETFHSRGVVRLEEVQTLFARQFTEDAGALAHPIQPISYRDINNFYTPTVYEKGAEVIRMMKTLLGDNFRKGTDCYFDRHDGQAVTCEDFVKALEDGSHTNLHSMRRWYTHYRTPIVKVERRYSEATGQLEITIEQKPTPSVNGASEPLCMPLQMALWDSVTGAKILEELLCLEQWQQTWSFASTLEGNRFPLLSINRGFSAPVLIELDHSEEEWLKLAQLEDDAVSSWISSGQLLKLLYLRYLSTRQSSAALSIEAIDVEPWITYVRSLLSHSTLDRHTKALLMRLPTPQEILEWTAIWDVEAAVLFYDTLHKSVAKRLKAELWNLYQSNHQIGKGSAEPENEQEKAQEERLASEKRQLKQAVLEYLVYTEEPLLFETVWQQMQSADCMSDEAGALRILSSRDNPLRDKAVELYQKRWSEDNLTWPRWFSYQALSSASDTLERAQALLSHPRFDMRIPNQARALIANLTSNVRVFHSVGQQEIKIGYEWLAKRVKEIDRFNAQLAAKLAKAYCVLPRLQKSRQEAMRAVIGELLSDPSLSSSVKEILERCLE